MKRYLPAFVIPVLICGVGAVILLVGSDSAEPQDPPASVPLNTSRQHPRAERPKADRLSEKAGESSVPAAERGPSDAMAGSTADTDAKHSEKDSSSELDPLTDWLINGPTYPDGYLGRKVESVAFAFKASQIGLIRANEALEQARLDGSAEAEVSARKEIARLTAIVKAIQSDSFEYFTQALDPFDSASKFVSDSSVKYLYYDFPPVRMVIAIRRSEFPDYFL